MIKLSILIPIKGLVRSKIKGYYISDDRLFIYCPTHPNCKPNGYYANARLVMENMLGRCLKRDEHIHHKNSNTMDDRLENLEIVSPQKHGKIHYSSKKMVDGRRKKYKNGWNPNLRGKRNPNYRGGKIIKRCENLKCNNTWYVFPSLFNHKRFCSKKCRLS